jgi:hypothetical protein
MTTSRPHDLCTLDETSDCSDCKIQNKLACKWDKKIKNCFLAIGFPPILSAIFGMVIIGKVTGTWWPLIAYVVYFMSMFSVFEIRFLCSHCPYYPGEGKTLRCLGNHGSPKFWRYHPEPIYKFEKFLMWFAVVAMIFFIFPLTVLGYGIFYVSSHFAIYGLISLLGLIGVSFATLLSSISFVAVLKTFFCSQCVNFSCTFNTVPKQVVDAYLKRNPVMKEAWEKSGYIIDS